MGPQMENSPLKGVLMKLFFHRSVSTVRNWMILAIFLFAGYGILDIYYLSHHLKLVWTIRFGIIIPLLLLMYSLTFLKRLKDQLTPILVVFLTIGTLGVNAVIAIASPDEKAYHFYFIGFILVIFWSHSAGLNSTVSTWVHIGIIVAYNVTAIFFQQLHAVSAVELFGNNMFLITVVLFSTISARIIESFIFEDHVKKKQLQEEHVIKDKLFSIISHDVRGPLSSIKGLLNLTSANIVTQAEFKDNSQKLTDSVDALMGFLDMLFLWSRDQKGYLPILKSDLNLHEVVSEVFKQYLPTAQQKSISLINNIDTTLKLLADSTMINLIMRNLVWNAIKFTSDGIILIRAQQTDKVTEIYVEDTGAGIDTRVIETVINGTNKISSIGTHNEKGFGFGLTICKEFIDRHAGTFIIKPKKDGGTIFCFTIPHPIDSKEANLETQWNKKDFRAKSQRVA